MIVSEGMEMLTIDCERLATGSLSGDTGVGTAVLSGQGAKGEPPDPPASC